MDDDAGDEDRVGHCLSRIAAATRSACTVSADVVGADDPRAALCRRQMRRDRAAEPLMRLRRHDRADEALARRADQQRQAEDARVRPAGPARSCSARASCRSRCRGRARCCRREIPALSAIASERAKKAAISCMMSMSGSTRSRLCMTITGEWRAANSRGHRRDRAAGPRRRWRWMRPHRAPRRRRPISCCRWRREHRGETMSARIGCRRSQFFLGRDRFGAIGPGGFRADVDDVGALGDHARGPAPARAPAR